MRTCAECNGAGRPSATDVPATDREAVLRAVADLFEQPLVVLGPDHVVKLANARAAELLGLETGALEGRSFMEGFVVPHAAEATASAIEAASADGAKRAVQIPVASAHGRLVSLIADVHAASELTCLVVRAHCELQPAQKAAPSPDVAFEISTEPETWGVVTRVLGRPGRSALRAGVRCYEAAGHAVPPTDCPVLAWAGGEGERHAVTSTCVPGHALIATVEQGGPTSVLVSGRLVPLDVLGTLADARIDELSSRGKLSVRERQVLVELVKSGDSLDVIAQRLGVSRATVKFHEANLLAKLGADSRIDLLRLLF